MRWPWGNIHERERQEWSYLLLYGCWFMLSSLELEPSRCVSERPEITIFFYRYDLLETATALSRLPFFFCPGNDSGRRKASHFNIWDLLADKTKLSKQRNLTNASSLSALLIGLLHSELSYHIYSISFQKLRNRGSKLSMSNASRSRCRALLFRTLSVGFHHIH